MNKLIKRTKGFTIIEVVLVLAIAALIFLMVFIALPALQKSQRDTARKNDASVVTAAVQNFVSAERRAIVIADQTALRTYIDKLDQYDATKVNIVAFNSTPKPATDVIQVYPASKCNGSKLAAGVTRQSAVVIRLEAGKGGTFYCIDV